MSECLCLPPLNLYVEVLVPSVMTLGGRAFGRWLGRTGRVFMNGISVLMKEALERYLAPFHHVRTVWTSRAFRTVRHEFMLLPRLVFCYRNLNGPRQGYFFIMFQTWAFLGSWLLLFQVWDIWGIKKKKPRQLTTMFYLRSQGPWLVRFLLFTFQSLLMFVLYTMSGVLGCT